MLYVSRSKSKIGEKEVVFCRKNFLACHLFLWPLSLDCPAGSIEVLRYTVQWLEYGAAGEWSWEEALWDRTFLVWVNPLNLLFIWIIVPPFLGTMRRDDNRWHFCGNDTVWNLTEFCGDEYRLKQVRFVGMTLSEYFDIMITHCASADNLEQI